jgi:hypothetical protein
MTWPASGLDEGGKSFLSLFNCRSIARNSAKKRFLAPRLRPLLHLDMMFSAHRALVCSADI